MADILDIFNRNAFSVVSMAAAMREIKYVPSFVSSLNIFRTQNISNIMIGIEKDKEQNIFIVRSSPRGAPGETFGKNSRSMRFLGIPHFQVDDAIYADEVQSVRMFGDDAAVETFQGRIAERAAEVSASFALTEEYHRLSVITKGQLLDKGGAVLFDYNVEFGEAMPAEIDFDLDNASPQPGAIRVKAAAVWRAMGSALDGIPFTGIIALCGDAFFDNLVNNAETRQTYLNTAEARDLRGGYLNPTGGTWGSFVFGDIMWVNYRGGQSVGIDTDKAYFIPLGVPDLFRTVYAPADYIETVNRPGQRLYAKQWRMPNDKGVNMEFQTNVLHYVTRPRVLMRARRT